MTFDQQALKKTLSYLAGILGIVIAAGAAGQVYISKPLLGWMGVLAGALGIFGASPIGRVIGDKESHAKLDPGPMFPPPTSPDDDKTPNLTKI